MALTWVRTPSRRPRGRGDSIGRRAIRRGRPGAVSAGDAPFLLIAGGESHDALVLPAQSERMHQLMQEAGGFPTLLTVLNADHQLQPTDGLTEPSAAVINPRLAEFFDQHVR